MPDQASTTDVVVYHGYQQQPSGGSVIALETTSGEPIGLLRHHVKHSASGFQWGYTGSGPAEAARCLLLDAVGDPKCPTCNGTHRVVATDDGGERPFDPDTDDPDGEDVLTCFDCDRDGLRGDLPYQDFKFEFVAGWGTEWRMSRAEVQDWLTSHGITLNPPTTRRTG